MSVDVRYTAIILNPSYPMKNNLLIQFSTGYSSSYTLKARMVMFMKSAILPAMTQRMANSLAALFCAEITAC